MYNLDRVMGVIHKLVFPVCWDDENILHTVLYHTTTIMCEHSHLLILLGCNFNNSVILANHKAETV